MVTKETSTYQSWWYYNSLEIEENYLGGTLGIMENNKKKLASNLIPVYMHAWAQSWFSKHFNNQVHIRHQRPH